MKELYYHFPESVDNTQIVAFKGCPVKWFYNHILHINPDMSPHLHFGRLYAEGHEVVRKAYYVEDYNDEQAVLLGVQHILDNWGEEVSEKETKVKTKESCMDLLQSYYAKYPLDSEEYEPIILQKENSEIESAIEFSFKEIIGNTPEGKPLYFTGRADMIVKSPYFGNKEACLVFDDKTTGSYISQHLLSQWETRSQFTAYCYFLRKAGIPAKGAVIALASLRGKEYSFERLESPRSSFMLDNWYRDMLRTVNEMKDFYWEVLDLHEKYPEEPLSAIAPKANLSNNCYSFSSKCRFIPACTLKTGERGILNSTVQNIWIPEEQTRYSLEEYLLKQGINLEKSIWTKVQNLTGLTI